jgi:hypothetical protein
MPDEKTSEIPNDLTPTLDDRVVTLDNPGGTPETRTSVISTVLALNDARTKTLTNTTFVADGTGNSISNIAPADHSASGTPSSTTYYRGDNTWSTPGDMVLSSVQENTGVKTFIQGSLKYKGSVSGETILNASSVAGATTLTLPAATDTLMGKATTDVMTNKTFDANATGNVLSNVDVADMSATGSPDATNFLRGDNTWATPAGSGDMVLAGIQSITGKKTYTANASSAVLNIANVNVTSGLVNGDIWRNAQKIQTHLGSTTREIVTDTQAQTLTTKTVALGSNTVSGTKAEFNTAVTDGTIAFLNQTNVYTAGDQDFFANISLPTAGRIELDGPGSLTYLRTGAANSVEVVINGTVTTTVNTTAFRLGSGKILEFGGAGESITNSGNNLQYDVSVGTNSHRFRVGNIAYAAISDDGITTTGRLALGHATDPLSTDSYIIESAADDVDFVVGNQKAFRAQEVGGKVNFIVGHAGAGATTDTNGFLYLPTVPGTPTGNPSDYTGKRPIVFDDTNDVFYINKDGTGTGWTTIGGGDHEHTTAGDGGVLHGDNTLVNINGQNISLKALLLL